MKRILLIATLVSVVAVPPLVAQGPVGIAHFVTVADQNVPQFEQALGRHMQFHRQQNDTWVWNVYQAMGGGVEYVAVSPGHMWADLDKMPVNPAADGADWARNGAQHSESVDMVIWNTHAQVSMPPALDAPVSPIVQTIEFAWDGGNASREAIMAAMKQFHSALSSTGAPFVYTWNEVMISDESPRFFAALFLDNFAGLDADDPEAMQAMLEGALGRYAAGAMMDAFDKHLKVTAVRFWMHRPDLSYVPRR